MAKVLRLQIAVQAGSRKMLQVGVNEAIAAVLQNSDAGQISKPGRDAWYTLESVDGEAAVPTLPEPEVVMDQPAVEIPPAPPAAFEPEEPELPEIGYAEPAPPIALDLTAALQTIGAEGPAAAEPEPSEPEPEVESDEPL